ncbi:MAG: hypothetical protein M1321_00645 [Candidatus Marsarchaeota archaeon]|nr:hypothetical protein [Candidatus Marsarchaeota archaeon]
MKLKLEPYLCYLAGLQSRSHGERNSIGVFTKSEALEQKFVGIALKDLKISPNHVLVEDNNGVHHVYFYHSRLGARLREISEKCNILFKMPTAQTRSYIAGIFDASGRISGKNLYVGGLSAAETIMLQSLGIQTSGDRIRSVGRLIDFVRGFSATVEGMGVSY